MIGTTTKINQQTHPPNTTDITNEGQILGEWTTKIACTQKVQPYPHAK